MFFGDTTTAAGRYSGSAAAVDMFVISYRSLSPQSELINETNRVFDPGRWMLVRETTGTAVDANGASLAYAETEIYEFGKTRRLIRHWYVVDGRPFRNRVAVKLIELGNILRGRPTAAGEPAVTRRTCTPLKPAGSDIERRTASGIASS